MLKKIKQELIGWFLNTYDKLECFNRKFHLWSEWRKDESSLNNQGMLKEARFCNNCGKEEIRWFIDGD